MENVLKEFRNGVKDLDDKNDIRSTTEDKNDIVCTMLTDQVAESPINKFVLPHKPFGDDTDPHCGGIGFKFLFDRELSIRVCLKCDGKGKKMVPCKKCQNGRYIHEKNGLRINLLCKFCNGTKMREVKCRTCRGTGELRKMVITPKIKSTTPCTHCHELGFIDKRLFAVLDDTLKFEEAADQLLEALIPSENVKVNDETMPVIESENAPSTDAEKTL